MTLSPKPNHTALIAAATVMLQQANTLYADTFAYKGEGEYEPYELALMAERSLRSEVRKAIAQNLRDVVPYEAIKDHGELAGIVYPERRSESFIAAIGHALAGPGHVPPKLPTAQL